MGTLRHPIRLSGLLAVLLIGPLHAQDLSGTWRGELVRGMNERFVIEMELVADAGRITGTSHVTFPFQQEHFANMAIEGQGQGRRYHLREARILEQGGTGYLWVLQGGPLMLDTTGATWRLYGEWQPPGCAPGQVMLHRTRAKEPSPPKLEPLPPRPPRWVEGRAVKWADEVDLPSGSVVLLLYDDKRLDGDTVTLFLNGTCIARNIPVPSRAEPTAIPITLVPGTNFLVMQAENLGSEPPNTAGLVFQAGEEVRKLVLRAEPDESAGLKIRWGP